MRAIWQARKTEKPVGVDAGMVCDGGWAMAAPMPCGGGRVAEQPERPRERGPLPAGTPRHPGIVARYVTVARYDCRRSGDAMKR